MKALRFATIVPLTLPKNAAVMSNYSISRNSVLSEQELLQRNRKDKELFRILREARSMSRTLSNKRTTSRVARETAEVRSSFTAHISLQICNTFSSSSCTQLVEDIRVMCTEAISLAVSLDDSTRKKQASTILLEVNKATGNDRKEN